MDFGIAKIASDSRTIDGTLLGSPKYMAPEQILGQPDRRSRGYLRARRLALRDADRTRALQRGQPQRDHVQDRERGSGAAEQGDLARAGRARRASSPRRWPSGRTTATRARGASAATCSGTSDRRRRKRVACSHRAPATTCRFRNTRGDRPARAARAQPRHRRFMRACRGSACARPLRGCGAGPGAPTIFCSSFRCWRRSRSRCSCR